MKIRIVTENYLKDELMKGHYTRCVFKMRDEMDSSSYKSSKDSHHPLTEIHIKPR